MNGRVATARDHCESPGRPLTHEEQNALRYVAGYIIRKVQQKLEKSMYPRKDEMVLLLMECAGDELSDNVGTSIHVDDSLSG